MKTTSKTYSVVIPSSEAGDLISVSAMVTIVEERESNYLEIKNLADLTAENGWELTFSEIELFQTEVLDQYIAYER